MFRFLLLLAVARSAVAVTEGSEREIGDIIDQIFGIAEDSDNELVPKPDCVAVEGDKGAGCYECRFCNDSVALNTRYQGNRIDLLLKDPQCEKEIKVCCVAQRDLLVTRTSDHCGKSNPAGVPRRRRTSVRALLQGEFPWRAWVYSKNSNTPLCAATYIDEDKKALITLASCVSGRAPGSLQVAFVRGGARAAVSRVMPHEAYRTGEDENNIAILELVSIEQTPTWAKPACSPCTAPPLVTPCLTSSAKDVRIDSVIPLRTACTRDNSSLPAALTCALAPPGDYEPEAGAGLYCLEQHVTAASYIVHGIFASENQDIGTYVNVWKFVEWLNSKLNIRLCE